MIRKFLVHRHIGTKSDIVLVSYNISQAQDARDAMVKKVYTELLQYLVNETNKEVPT